MPTFKDIRAKNANFAQSARDNAGKPRIRASQRATSESSAASGGGGGGTSEGDSSVSSRSEAAGKRTRGRNIVKPAKRDRLDAKSKSKLSTVALAIICFVVVGGVFFELLRLFF